MILFSYNDNKDILPSADVVEEMTASGESVPEPLSEKKYSGRFMIRIPSLVHRTLATEAPNKA